jgi:hypothetical protein
LQVLCTVMACSDLQIQDFQTNNQPISFLYNIRNIHRPITLTQQATFSEPKASTAEHKKVSDIKHLHPFKNKVIPLTQHSIPLSKTVYRNLLTFLGRVTKNRMAGNSEDNEDC